MSVLPVGISGEAGAYQIERSLRFDSSASSYLNRTPASASNRKTWTWSGWVKRSALSSLQKLFAAGTGTAEFSLQFTASNEIEIYDYTTPSYAWRKITTSLYRDPSAWYMITLAYDTTQATASNRIKLYVNGTQVTAFSTSSDPSLNYDGYINNNTGHAIGAFPSAANFFSGYLTEVHFIDGSALTPTSFGEFNTDTGVWQPKKYTGTYGTNGFYLDFADNTSTTTLGYDAAGSNDWTLNNFSVTAGAGNDSLVDSPTRYGTDTGAGGEVRGNYATWNPLDKDDGITSVTQGNLTVVTNGSNGSIKSTIAFPSGKWYWEVTSDSVNAGGTQAIGIIPQSQPPTNNMSDSGKLGYAIDASNSDRKFDNGTATNYGSYTQGNGVIYMLAFDQSAGKLWYGVGGTWLASGDPATDSNPSSSGISTSTAYCAAVSDNTLSGTFTANFGQRPFAYTAPSGFKALCTTNLPTPTIEDGGEYFNAILYTGTGSSNARTGVGFQPDLVWIKERNAAADHALYDAVRGVQNQLESNTTTAETAEANGLTAFGADGFTVGSLAQVNTSTDTYVAWNWKANGAGSSNTAGTITSTVSANTDAGFSIVTYTGTGANATVGHGLGVAPSMVIVKCRSNAISAPAWPVWHPSLAGTEYLDLQTTAAKATAASVWNSTTPTSTVFSVGTTSSCNSSSYTYVAYCFAPVAGYSAFGSVTGNGSADGPFVFLNFRPAFVMLKRTDSTSNWTILDFAREGYNVDNDPLYPNLSNAEGTTDLADLLSNGFKLRSTDASVNASGGTYVYAAFSESPFAYSLAR